MPGSEFGAVLHQDPGPLAFFSRTFATRHLKIAAYERELIGLVQAVRHWRPYLWGHHFHIRTDHFALKFMLDQRLSTIPQHQWVTKLFGFDFTIEYKPGHFNTVADALSRQHDMEASSAAISEPTFTLFDDLRREAPQHPDWTEKWNQIQAGTMTTPWHIVDGLILHGNRVFVLATSSSFPDILQLAHSAVHAGIQKTLHRLRVDFHINRDRALVQEFVRSCTVCQHNETVALHPAGLLQPLPVPSQVWADISLDFIQGLPKVHGKSVILTVVDRFSKYAHFIALGHPYTSATVARAFFDGIVRLLGHANSVGSGPLACVRVCICNVVGYRN